MTIHFGETFSRDLRGSAECNRALPFGSRLTKFISSFYHNQFRGAPPAATGGAAGFA
jgi:hypothetical protein